MVISHSHSINRVTLGINWKLEKSSPCTSVCNELAFLTNVYQWPGMYRALHETLDHRPLILAEVHGAKRYK